jgi:hypothetical protein
LYHHTPGGTARAWLDHDDPTVGGLHPSDLGHTRIAEFWEAFLPPLLKAADERMAAEAAAGRTTAAAAALDEQQQLPVTATTHALKQLRMISQRSVLRADSNNIVAYAVNRWRRSPCSKSSTQRKE